MYNAGHIRHRWTRELSTVRARALGYWLRGHTRHHAHDVEAARLVDSTNLLARDLMSGSQAPTKPTLTREESREPRRMTRLTNKSAVDAV